MKKVLLTGSTGFIGRNILENKLLNDKYDIVAPKRQILDLNNEESVERFFKKNNSFDAVIHCATKPAHRNAKDLSDIYKSNLNMFYNLVKHKDSFKKFINLGSGAIYNQKYNISNAKEADIYATELKDEYAKYKFEENQKIQKLDNFVDLILFGVFGKYEDWEIRFISNAICKSLYTLPITLRQNRRFSYLYIEDLMPIIEFFIENETKYKTYNVVPTESTELLTIANIVQSISKNKEQIKISKDGYGYDYTGNNERLLSEHSFKFTPLKKSINELYTYYLENKDILKKELLLQDK